MMIALVAMLTIAATGKAMSYEQARNEALFLTDKMAYELNLTDAQYEAAYEINLDYLMGVTSYDDVFGTYWERRNMDLSYILLDWQWKAFCAATYFYRPLYWSNGFWHFGIYARYPHRDYFFYGRPAFYVTYRGGHAWHRVGGYGYYHGRRDRLTTVPFQIPRVITQIAWEQVLIRTTQTVRTWVRIRTTQIVRITQIVRAPPTTVQKEAQIQSIHSTGVVAVEPSAAEVG